MLKNFRAHPQSRPLSRLEFNLGNENRTKLGVPLRFRAESQGNPWKKTKNAALSPTKENDKPRVNLNREKQVKAAPTGKVELPVIRNRKKLSEEGRNRKKPVEDFETYCSKGHVVFVDERDSGVKLGHLTKNGEQNERKLSEHKNYLGETAYVPYNIEALKRKV